MLNNLGVVARERKDYAKAEEYYRRALSIREKALAPDHPDIAANLSNLATIYRATGDSARALETNFRALAIFEKTAGPYTGGTVLSLGNIARTYAMIGDVPNALAFQRRVDAALETQLTLNLSIGSERQKLAFAESISERTDRTISLHLSSGDPAAGALALLVILQRKGRVLDAMTDSLGALRQRIGNAADQELLDRLNTTTTSLARLTLNAAQNTPPQERLQTIARLEADKEKLEADISEHSAEFRSQSRPVTLEAIQATIPRGAALVEFTRFRPFDPKAERNLEAYGASHYVAYVLGADGDPRGHDLGLAAPIDRAVGALLEALRDPQRNDVSALARAADEKVLQPIRGALGDATRLLISPDGPLNLMPFEVLRDGQGRYAVERYTISYLTSGRDLLRMQVPRASRSGPVIVADPAFGDAAAAAMPISSATVGARRSITSAEDLAAVYFAPLAGTAREARTIGALFPDARVPHAIERDEARGHGGDRAEHPAHRDTRVLHPRRAGEHRARRPREPAAAFGPRPERREPPGRRRARRHPHRARGGEPEPVGNEAGRLVRVRHRGRRSAQRRRRVRPAARLRSRRRRNADHEPVAGQRRRHPRVDVGLLPWPASGPRPRRRAARDRARHAETARPPASVLLGQLHSGRRMGEPRRAPLTRLKCFCGFLLTAVEGSQPCSRA